jgi:hypothetical protein
MFVGVCYRINLFKKKRKKDFYTGPHNIQGKTIVRQPNSENQH